MMIQKCSLGEKASAAVLVRGEAVVCPVDDLCRAHEAGRAELVGQGSRMLGLRERGVVLCGALGELLDESECLWPELSECAHDERHEFGLSLLRDVLVFARLAGFSGGNGLVR